MKNKWVTRVLVFLIVFIIAFPIIYFLSHYSFWRVVLLSALAGAVMAFAGAWTEYNRSKRNKQ